MNIVSGKEQEPVIEGGSTSPSEQTVYIVTNDMISDVCDSDGVISMVGDDGDSDGATALLSLADMAPKKAMKMKTHQQVPTPTSTNKRKK